MRKFISQIALIVASLAATAVILETGCYLALRLTPVSFVPFRDIMWMRGAFHPLFRSLAPDPYGYWPYVGHFFSPVGHSLPAGLPRPFPEAYVFQDSWGRMTPMAKPKNELRVCVLGGSTVMGQGSTGPEMTIPGRLEHWLRQRQPPGSLWTIRVVNGGVGGYTSTQEQVLMTTRLLSYEPDAFVVVDGYNDFMELWSSPNLPPFWNSYNKHLYEGFNRMQSIRGMTAQLGFLLSQKLYCLALPRVLRRYRNLSRENGGATPGASTKDIAQQHMDRALWIYSTNQRTMLGTCAEQRIPLVAVLQPTLAVDKPASAQELRILDGQEAAGNAGWKQVVNIYYKRLRSLYQTASRQHPGAVLDESGLFRENPETLYSDHCHYNDTGADLVAKQLAAPVYAALKRRVGRGL